jgi:hypothetical protein
VSVGGLVRIKVVPDVFVVPPILPATICAPMFVVPPILPTTLCQPRVVPLYVCSAANIPTTIC